MRTEVIGAQCRFWVGVVSAAHVSLGVQGRFAQLNHKKAGPLRKMAQGDWLVYYSPRTDTHGGTPVRGFTAIGCLADDLLYPYLASEHFIAFRRRVRYVPCHTAKISAMLGALSFIQDSAHWGYLFRRGHFEIGREDFLTNAQSMWGEAYEFGV